MADSTQDMVEALAGDVAERMAVIERQAYAAGRADSAAALARLAESPYELAQWAVQVSDELREGIAFGAQLLAGETFEL